VPLSRHSFDLQYILYISIYNIPDKLR